MAHIPKRATQHGVFLAGNEVPRPCLKPGQDQLCRQNYYTTEAKDLEHTYLAYEMSRTKNSEYQKNIAQQTSPVDYEDPQKPLIPPCPVNKAGHMGTGHWRSEYSQTFSPESIDGAVHQRQVGPPFEAANPPAVVSAPNELSMYSKEFGVYGSNPRMRLSKSDTKLPCLKHELTVGTTKATSHIPGYQGFLPTNTNNPKVRAIECGENLRTVNKTNLNEIFHLNLPGYRGHVAANARNDKGGRQIMGMSVFGKDYSAQAGYDRASLDRKVTLGLRICSGL